LPKDDKKKYCDKFQKIKEQEMNDVPLRFQILDRNDLLVTQKQHILDKIDQLANTSPNDNEYFKLQKYLKGIQKIPFDHYYTLPFILKEKEDFTKNSKEIFHFLQNIEKTLDECIYGQNKAKHKLIEYIAQSISNPKTCGNVIALSGSPGIGKTSLIRDGLSKALNRPFEMIALGGASDSSYLDGHSYTYEGSQWGRIVDVLIHSQCMNPVIFFDELDKVSTTRKGEEITNLLIHITDPTQNNVFQDRYFSGIDIDLSKCFFVFSLNNIENIHPILKDRLTIIELDGFKSDEKIEIGKKYLLPSICKNIGFPLEEIQITDEVYQTILQKYLGKEPGVRELKRCLEMIIQKMNMAKMTGYLTENSNLEITSEINEIEKSTKWFSKSFKSFKHDPPYIFEKKHLEEIFENYIVKKNDCPIPHMYL